MKRDEFEKLVIDAIDNLPEQFRSKIKNLAVVIEDKPTEKTHRSLGGPKDRDIILGLYEGVPLLERTHMYGMVMPDKITIYKKNIERVCRTDAEIKQAVIHTVRHEVAHHFGISDEELREGGIY
ncbi:MAG: metallopeptidase family protein [Planctomycetota bacterium]